MLVPVQKAKAKIGWPVVLMGTIHPSGVEKANFTPEFAVPV